MIAPPGASGGDASRQPQRVGLQLEAHLAGLNLQVMKNHAKMRKEILNVLIQMKAKNIAVIATHPALQPNHVLLEFANVLMEKNFVMMYV